MEQWHYADVTAVCHRTEPCSHKTRRSFTQAVPHLTTKTTRLFFARNDVHSTAAALDNHQKTLNKTTQYTTVRRKIQNQVN
jgi:hypothetical protein